MGRERLVEVLDRVGARVAAGQVPVVVFDLDSTLFATAHRNLAILRDFVGTHGHEFPDLDAHVAALEPDDMGWEVLAPLRDRGYAPDDLPRRFVPFWKDRFFADEWLDHDEPNPGAAEFARGVHGRGGLVYYLTGRHVGGMEIGTVRALVRHGFPMFRARTVLHLKPGFDVPDFEFKRDAVADIRSHGGPVEATFENEPGNANLFLKSFPEGLHFLLLTEHSPNAEVPDPALIQIPDFRT